MVQGEDGFLMAGSELVGRDACEEKIQSPAVIILVTKTLVLSCT